MSLGNILFYNRRHLIIILPSLFFILMYLVIAVKTIGYPFQLEWMEGGTMEIIARILDKKPIYSEPDIDYVPYIYTPFYYQLSAFFAKYFGLHFYVPRTISFISFITLLFVIYTWLRKEDVSKSLSFLSIGLFTATFEASGSWFHVARVDSLFLLLIFSAFYFLYHHKCAVTALVAGLLLFLSFMTKQTALIIALPTIIMYSFFDTKRTLITFSFALLLFSITHFYLNDTYPIWYQFFVYDLPKQHRIIWLVVISYWIKDLFMVMPIAFVLSLVSLFLIGSHNYKRILFYLTMMAGFLGGAYASRIHSGGWVNVLMPAYLILSVMTALSLHYLQKHHSYKKTNVIFRETLHPLIIFAVIVQFIIILYNPLKYIPSTNDLNAGNKFTAYISDIDGDILVPDHRFLTHISNKKTYSIGMSGNDILRMDVDSEIKHNFRRKIDDMVANKKFSAIILSQNEDFHDHLKYYRFKEKIFSDDDTFFPVTGRKMRPNFVFIPKESTQ